MGDNLVPSGLSMVCKVLCSRPLYLKAFAEVSRGEARSESLLRILARSLADQLCNVAAGHGNAAPCLAIGHRRLTVTVSALLACRH